MAREQKWKIGHNELPEWLIIIMSHTIWLIDYDSSWWISEEWTVLWRKLHRLENCLKLIKIITSRWRHYDVIMTSYEMNDSWTTSYVHFTWLYVTNEIATKVQMHRISWVALLLNFFSFQNNTKCHYKGSFFPTSPKNDGISITLAEPLYAMVAKMSQNGCDRDRSRDWH